MTDYLDHPGIFEDEEMVLDEAKRIIARQRAREIVTARTAETFQPPEILTLDQRLRLPRPEVIYRIDGWQPANSRIICSAQYKAGKTTLTGNLVRSLVDGEPWLGVAEVQPVKALTLLDFEMGGYMLDDWLHDQGIYNENRVRVASLRGQASTFNILDPAIRETWAGLLTGTDYLIVDPLKPVLDALGLDERSEAGRFLTAFDELLAAADIPDAFINHHMGHHGERSRGDSTLRGWPDVEWFIIREDDDPGSPRYIKAFGRDVEQPEALLNYDHDTRHLTLTGGTRSDAKARALIPQLVEAVNSASEPLLLKDLNEAIEGRKSDISQASHLAEYQGLVAVEIGPRRARIHRPILTTGSGTSQRSLVPSDRNQSETSETPDGVGENRDDPPTSSDQFPPVPEPVGVTGSQVYVPGTGEPVRSDNGLCPVCSMSDGHHSYVCRRREPATEESAS